MVRTWAWWTSRSMMAVAMVSSWKIVDQAPNVRFEVIRIEDCSYRLEMSWKNRFAASGSMGR